MLLGALMLPAAAHAQNINGDVNGDLEVNIADVNAVINVILGGDSIPRADVNNDGEVNIADVNAVIDIILNPVVVEEHEWVDLGLPSGTLWATCNIGANSPEEYGDYFAWGETAPKDNYDWRSYKWCIDYHFMLTKYCDKNTFGYNGFVDNKTELDPEDDAACVNWGSSWRMPTAEQQQELYNNCTSIWATLDGVNGRLFTGPNGNTLFLPAAGIYYDSGDFVGWVCNYWSRTLYFYPNDALYLYIDSPSVRQYHRGRAYGLSVRAVHVP